jgi:hypothetical protein
MTWLRAHSGITRRARLDAGLGEVGNMLERIRSRYRCEVPAGVTLGYSRDDRQVDISVRSEDDPVTGRVRIQRLGEGNPWPPEC